MKKFVKVMIISSCLIILIMSGCDSLSLKDVQRINETSNVQQKNEIKVFCSSYTTFIIKNGEVYATGLTSDYCDAGFIPQKKYSSDTKYNDTFVLVAKNISHIGDKGLNCYLVNKNLNMKGKNEAKLIVDDVSLMTDGYMVAYVKDSKVFCVKKRYLEELCVEDEPEQISGLPDGKIVDILLWCLSIHVLYDNGEKVVISLLPEDEKGYEIIYPDKKLYSFKSKPVKLVKSYSEMGIGIIDENSSFYSLRSKLIFEARNVRDAFYGIGSTYYLLNDGTLWGKGENTKGQLGTGDTRRRNKYVKIMDNVKSIAGGINHVVAVKKDNSVYGFGSNELGQLSGTKKKYIVPTEIKFE